MDRITGSIIAFLGIGILWEGGHLTRGTLGHPGPGFFPTLLATLLIILSLFLIIPKGKKEEGGEVFPPWSTIYRQLIPIYAALLAFTGLLDFVGFILLTLLLMFFLFVKISYLKWYTAMLAAFVSTGVIYFIFGLILKSSFPIGLLSF
jgi:putative tricarboxylic transport membrane protein